MYIHTHIHTRTYTRVITRKTPFTASQKHNNSYAKNTKRILSRSKPRILSGWISCKANR